MRFDRFYYIVYFTALAAFVPFVGLAQDGIKFEKGLSWSAIVGKAKEERKYIFMDCYTTWCGPCKYMSRNIFTQKIVGDFFNANFINVSVQMDRTEKDSESIKAWYAEADSIAVKYRVNAYPTYLFFSPNGQVLHRFVGSLESSKFLGKAADALNPKKQYYNLIYHSRDHLGDSIFLRNALSMAEESEDETNAAKIAEDYFGSLRDPFAIENVDLLTQVKMLTSGKVFQFFLMNASRLNQALGKDSLIEYLIGRCIKDEQITPLFKIDSVLDYNEVVHHFQNEYPTLVSIVPVWVGSCFKYAIQKSINAVIYKEGTSMPDWMTIAQIIRSHYPGYDCSRIIDESKPKYYEYKRMWPQCEKSALALFDRYGDQLDAHGINVIVWYYLFKYSSDPRVLKVAIKWSKRSVDMAPNDCANIDTYANLLYKMGDRKTALKWEKKAIENRLADDEIRANFEKMKKGQKTWMDVDRQKS